MNAVHHSVVVVDLIPVLESSLCTAVLVVSTFVLDKPTTHIAVVNRITTTLPAILKKTNYTLGFS